MKLTGSALKKKDVNVNPTVTRHLNSDGDPEFVDIFLAGPDGYLRGKMTLSEARRLANDLTNTLKPVSDVTRAVVKRVMGGG